MKKFTIFILLNSLLGFIIPFFVFYKNIYFSSLYQIFSIYSFIFLINLIFFIKIKSFMRELKENRCYISKINLEDKSFHSFIFSLSRLLVGFEMDTWFSLAIALVCFIIPLIFFEPYYQIGNSIFFLKINTCFILVLPFITFVIAIVDLIKDYKNIKKHLIDYYKF